MVGIDDAPFPRSHRGDVLVVGAVYSGLRLEGVLASRVRRDGSNASRNLARMIGESKFAKQLQLVLLQGMNNAAVHQAITNCDIVLDQFVGGWYGMLAVEAMATGKPVLAYLRPDLLHRQCAEVPIVNTTPEALRDTLRDLIHDGECRHALGQAGRAFVERRHECGSVARGMLHDILGADRADAS